MPDKRSAGVLLHPTSLPGKFGIGDLGDEAFAFLHWCAEARQSVWQILPLGPTGFGNSPYGSLSAFALNPLLVSPKRLFEGGLIHELPAETAQEDRIDFDAVTEQKSELLEAVWRRFNANRPSAWSQRFERFQEAAEQQAWLDDFALFSALKEKHGGREWRAWPDEVALRGKDAIAGARRELEERIEFHKFVQMLVSEQWSQIRTEAHRLRIRIIGDLPIYVAYDSADVWSHPDLFDLDDDLRPNAVAGVPPDYFSETGQRWGNPLYRWDRMAERGFDWWIDRVKANLRLTDIVRLDHFRGFAGYWEVPAHEETAVNGQWRTGPGLALFGAIRKELGSLPLVAEDLGTITPDVDQLRHDTNLPGMRVLQFGFGEDHNIHMPHRYEVNSVVYTGTHDNDTSRGWFESAAEHEKERALQYLGAKPESVVRQMVRSLFASVANMAVVPLQDLFDLGSDARMNTPGDSKGNWAWRSKYGLFADTDVVRRLKRLTEITGRVVH